MTLLNSHYYLVILDVPQILSVNSFSGLSRELLSVLVWKDAYFSLSEARGTLLVSSPRRSHVRGDIVP